MRFQVFATDYDGTLAHDGQVDPPALEALQRLREAGRTLILATGRELPDLLSIFPEIGLFHKVVAENGALLYTPATREEKLLGEKPPDLFVKALVDRGIQPLSLGRIIISTWQPNENAVLEIIKHMGLEHTISFNKGAVMILPPGVNKATGLKAALNDVGITADHVVGVGDGENDHAFLKACGCSVAVSNALPMLQQNADVVLSQPDGEGILTLIREILDNDLASFEARRIKHRMDMEKRETAEKN